MKIIVFGATGGTGRAVIRALLAKGHLVTAFARNPSALDRAPGLDIVAGDAMNPAEVARAMPGHDGAVVTLGNSQNPFALLLGARRTTPPNICEVGTRNVIAAMHANNVRRLIVVSSFGVGDTKYIAPFMTKLFFRLLLREQMADKEKQEPLVKASGLDWTLVQPVGLTEGAAGEDFASASGEVKKLTISRAGVAAFIARELADPAYRGKSVALSAS
jgi:uncharacterized protein YbjT (DUF2867 family)